MEFRHPSWFCEEVYEVLHRHGIALVSVSSGILPADLTVTADFTYLRFHGLAGGAAHDYSPGELAPWAKHLKKCAAHGIDVYAYFNNDVNTRAPLNAESLIRMVEGRK